MVWEMVFMLLVLKIPIVYLCAVVWYAIKAEPSPPDLDTAAVVPDTPPPNGPSRHRRSRRPRPGRPHAPGRASRAPQKGGMRA